MLVYSATLPYDYTPPPPFLDMHVTCSMCCVFLAFKVDEYNVTLEQFIETLSQHFPAQQLQHISDFILSHEVSTHSASYSPTSHSLSLPLLTHSLTISQLFLLQKLKFHLTVHSPFRPLKGFLVDMKVCVCHCVYE